MRQQADSPGRGKRSSSPRQAALEIVHRLRGAGFEALLAGGCVRDMLMGREPKDYDVATNARPEELLRQFRRTLKVGVQFGVVIVGDFGPWVEVATFRSDVHYSDGRHPDRVVFSSAREDAVRRDFTVNGLFYDPIEDLVIDYVGGQEDLSRRVLRAIGAPHERFTEDHLRLVRAIRFAATLGFAIDPATWQAVMEHAPLLATVSRERILDEMERMLTDAGRAVGMRLLGESGLLPYAVPAAGVGTAWPIEMFDRACARLKELPAEADFACGLAAALADWPAERVDDLCREMTCSNELRKQVVWLIEALPRARQADRLSLADLKRLMASGCFENLKTLLRAELIVQHESPDAWRVLCERSAAIPAERVQPAPLVGGEDIKALSIEPGPVYKKVLDAVYTAQLNEQLAEREEALNMLRKELGKAGYVL